MHENTKTIPVGEVIDFYDQVKSCRIKTESLLSGHYTKMYELDDQMLRSVLTLNTSCYTLREYLEKTFKVNSEKVRDGSVKGFKLEEKAKVSFAKIMVTFVLDREEVLSRNISLSDN